MKTLIDNINEYYDTDISKPDLLAEEIAKLRKHYKILLTMSNLRAWIKSYLCNILDRHVGDKSVKDIQDILVQNELINWELFDLPAWRTYPVGLYSTRNATQKDKKKAVIVYSNSDSLRQMQQDNSERYLKKKAEEKLKTPEEITERTKNVRVAKHKGERLAKELKDESLIIVADASLEQLTNDSLEGYPLKIVAHLTCAMPGCDMKYYVPLLNQSRRTRICEGCRG